MIRQIFVSVLFIIITYNSFGNYLFNQNLDRHRTADRQMETGDLLFRTLLPMPRPENKVIYYSVRSSAIFHRVKAGVQEQEVIKMTGHTSIASSKSHYNATQNIIITWRKKLSLSIFKQNFLPPWNTINHIQFFRQVIKFDFVFMT